MRSQKASKFAHASIDLLGSERLTLRDIAGNFPVYVASLGGFMRHISGRRDAVASSVACSRKEEFLWN